MGRSLWALRALCPGPLATARLMAVYLRLMLADPKSPVSARRLRLRVGGRVRDWWVGDAGEVGALWEVFVVQQYADFLPADVRVIIDAGANVGTATAWFRARFPKARVIAMEPDPLVVERLRRNLGEDPQVEIVEAALSDTDEPVRFAPGRWTMLGQVADDGRDEGSMIEVPAVTLASLRDQLGLRAVDVLKLDTEGSEWRILTQSLEAVRVVPLEVHPPAPDGRDADDVLEEIAKRQGFELRRGTSPTIRWFVRPEDGRDQT